MGWRLQRWLLLALTCCWSAGNAQEWQVGAAGGFGFYRDAVISNAAGVAKAGFGPRFALGAVVGRDFSEHLGAELRYTFRDGDLMIASGGLEANLDGDAHALHPDLLVYFRRRGARIRPFVAGGAGIKLYRGTQSEPLSQPLRNFARLARIDQAEPLISIGGGIKVAVISRITLRLDLRDYITPFPGQVIVPAPSAKESGWLHDFVPMLGVSFGF